jgi:DNA-binding response OmpR family regulator
MMEDVDSRLSTEPTRIVAGASNVVAIVEDDHTLRAALCGALEDAGLSAHPASTLPNARKLLGVLRPAAMVLDLKLDGVDASPLIAEMRDEGMDVPVVIISADEGLLRRQTKDARTTVLAKPFDLDELVAAVLVAVAQ